MKMTARLLFCFALAPVSILWDVPGQAQITPLLQVPESVREPDRRALITEQKSLESRKLKLQSDGRAFNADCAWVEKGSADDAECARRFAHLESVRRQYVSDVKNFNDRVQAATPSAQPGSLLLPPSRVIPQGALDLPAPTIAPGSLVSADSYESALRNRERLVKLRQLLEAKIGELRRWRGDIQRYQEEFESLRLAAVHLTLSDILEAVPAEAIVARLVKTPRYARYLPVDFEAKFTTALEAVKTVHSIAEGISARDDADRFKKIAEGSLSIRKALQAIPIARENEEVRRWLDAMDKSYEIAVKVSAFTMKDGSQALPERIAEWAELARELGGVLSPPFGATAYIGTQVVVRPVQAFYARSALNDLGNALSSNWNAELYLREKIQRTHDFIAEQERTISSYEAAHPEAASARRR